MGELCQDILQSSWSARKSKEANWMATYSSGPDLVTLDLDPDDLVDNKGPQGAILGRQHFLAALPRR